MFSIKNFYDSDPFFCDILKILFPPFQLLLSVASPRQPVLTQFEGLALAALDTLRALTLATNKSRGLIHHPPETQQSHGKRFGRRGPLTKSPQVTAPG